ncbi:peptidylprolyl isomerase SurA [Endozoicomonas sp. G2_1]|uniref:peptidylprolyl isomerase SurA n=1 Tax=Endozoicomonas sp. G2_1 TaxID=2821091 RepID=UPI001ADA014E|nr:peptidylprolyl isomerase SurA [Endozoicomonas sp. G2_1]MBO9491103.1 peptidylprolyl isomerase SurA [Endozoicomonas sp. G2_1]
MKKLFKTYLVTGSLALSLMFNLSVQAKPEQIDRVAAIVDSGVVLESEVQALLENIKANAQRNNQSLPSDRALRTQVIDKLINDSIVLQLGERMGVQVSDAQLDDTLSNMARENNLSLEQLRDSMVNDGIDYERYRENIRNELISGEVRRANIRRRIYISEQEIANLLDAMKEQSNTNIEYNLGHILIEFPSEPTQADINSAKDRADKVLELLNNGSDFTKIAIASSGAGDALSGGDMGWQTVNEMPTLFSEVVDGQDKGAVFGPIRTGLGFSIIKVLDIRGREVMEVEEVKSRHILIKPSIIVSESKAESILKDFLAQVKAGEADFAELAKEHSEGPTSVRGGDLGWADPNSYDPAFKDALARLKVDEYHEPFRSSFGWHLVQLTGRRTLDATAQMNENRAYQLLYNRKFNVENVRWMKEKRDEAYIEIIEQGEN